MTNAQTAITAAATPPRLAGAESPQFRGALNLWLNNDEANALPLLASLAQEGNAAARLLLGMIDKSAALQGPFLAHLDRRDRLALLRAPGGMSGQSWLDSIADTVPFAAAYRDLMRVNADTALLGTFARLGEPRAMREAMVLLAARESPALNALDPASVAPELLYLLWTGASDSRRREIESRVPATDPQRVLMGQPSDARDLDRWLASASVAAPITALCDAVCPQDGMLCRAAAYRALNSHNALITLGSPAETLIPQQVFFASPRGLSSVMRRILLATSMRGRGALLARVTEEAACLGEALSAENQRYRPTLPGTISSD